MSSQQLTTQIFNSDCILRLHGTPDDPQFCVKDVCQAIGIKAHRRKLSTLDAEYIKRHTLQTTSGPQLTCFVTEPGLYQLIMTCRRRRNNPDDLVKRFQKWVFEDVLPSIRRTGHYDRRQEQLQDRNKALVELAIAHFSHDADIMCLATEKMKEMLSGSSAAATQPRLLPISVALELQGRFPAKLITKHRSAVGRMVARAYRQQHGRAPQQTGQNVLGRYTMVNAYSHDDLEALLPVANTYLESKQ